MIIQLQPDISEVQKENLIGKVNEIGYQYHVKPVGLTT